MSNEDKFWGEDPNVLFSTFHFFPLQEMTLNEKINAFTRSIICISIIIILYFQTNHIVPFIITMILIYLITIHVKKEGFSEKEENINTETNTNLIPIQNIQNKLPPLQAEFQAPSFKNPLSNVLLTDNSSRFPAPPISNTKVNDDILIQAKKMVQQLNPNQSNVVDKLFKDLDQEMSFEQSLRPFYSTANTSIPNDQGAFAEFCYGSMTSCKEGNLFACARNLNNHYNI